MFEHDHYEFFDDEEPDPEYTLDDIDDDVSYFSENEIDHREIKGAITAGEIVPWRVSADGRQWYRRIEAVPPKADHTASHGIISGLKKMIFGIPGRDQ